MNFEQQQHGATQHGTPAAGAPHTPQRNAATGPLYFQMATATKGDAYQAALQRGDWRRVAELLDAMSGPELMTRLRSIQAAGHLPALTAAALTANRTKLLAALKTFEPSATQHAAK
jgi:hypothetical protein